MFFLFFIFNLICKANDDKINITLYKNSNQTKTFITYSFRFSSFSDVIDVYLIPLRFYNTFDSMDLKDFFVIKYYGFTAYPFRYFAYKNSSKINSRNESYSNINGSSKLKLFDIFDIREGIDYYFFDIFMKKVSKDWDNISNANKKRFISDLKLLNLQF